MDIKHSPHSIARIATGLWFIAYALAGVTTVPAPILLVLAAIAGICWLFGI